MSATTVAGVEVVPFTDQYELVAPVYGISVEELRRRDERQDRPVQRWIAVDGDEGIGAVTARARPDDRTFLAFACRDQAAYASLTETVVTTLGRPVATRPVLISDLSG